jgi:hypothetical protein
LHENSCSSAVCSRSLCCVVNALTFNRVQAAEGQFLERFRGNWFGSGKVQREGRSQPQQVTCSVTGSPAENRISAQGSCRAVLIFRRQISVDLSYDPSSGTYRGTYTGSRIGPARLTGSRSGNAVNLRIEWPRPVNGDTQAAMIIQNDGQGTLRITIADNLTSSGPIEQTSEIVLGRR